MRRARKILGWLVLAGSALACSRGAGQTLAHRNWQGSGLTVQTWWAHAVFCSSASNPQRVTGDIETLVTIGCDAVEVSPGSGYSAIAEMDALTEAAGQRHMRVVADLNGSSGEQELRERIAFWGTRGVAGFAVKDASDAVVSRLRLANAGRLIVGDGGQLPARQLPEGDAISLRLWFTAQGTARQAILLEDRSARLAKAHAAMLLATGGPARIMVDALLPAAAKEATPSFSAEDLLLWVPAAKGADTGATEWVHALSTLHHENTVLRTGHPQPLNLDASGVLGWIVTGRDAHEALLVLCNLSGKQVQVPVSEAIRASGSKRTYLKTLLRSDGSATAADAVSPIRLEAEGVFIGALH